MSHSFSRAHDRTRTDDLFLTKEVLYLLSYVGPKVRAKQERETGLEPATPSLEGWRSSQLSYSRLAPWCPQDGEGRIRTSEG
jgi:hypothetical protein